MEIKMNVYVVYLTDVIGNQYLGVKYHKGSLSEQTVLWEGSFFNTEHVSIMKANKEKRDGESHHSKVINVMEYKKLIGEGKITKDILESFMGKPIEIVLKGIGKAENTEKGNITNFIVIDSEALQGVREIFGLSQFDFHITLGFDKKDVFGKSKSEDSIFVKF